MHEMNVIYNATYNGVSLNGARLYVYGLPICSECAKGIIQVGIEEVIISAECLNLQPHWVESWKTSADMFAEARILVKVI